MIFEFEKYMIDIDVEKTRDFYSRADKITDGCDCSGCRNYEKWATTSFSCTETRHILKQMGVQMEKPVEVYVNYQNEDGSVFYGGFYHLCGRILQGCEVWNEISEKHKTLNEMVFVELCDGYRVAFTEEIDLLEKNIPAPLIQIPPRILWSSTVRILP